MTLDNDLKLVKMGGVTCVSDLGLYYSTWSYNIIVLLSVYGSPQEVRAVLSGITSSRVVEVLGVGEIRKSFYENAKIKTLTIGYGKRNGLFYSEEIWRNIIFWFSPEEKLEALVRGLSRRKIPFSPEFVPLIEELLVEEGHFEELKGWGGVSGYLCNWNDDRICNLIGKKIMAQKGGKDGIERVHQEIRGEVGFQGRGDGYLYL